MFWVIQETLYEAREFEDLKRMLGVLDLPFISVVALRDGTLRESESPIGAPEPSIPTDQPIFVLGTYALSRIAQARGWQPGALSCESTDFGTCLKGWGAAMLNEQGTQFALRDVRTPPAPCFIRPYHDNKAFNGQVMSPDELTTWRNGVVAKAPSLVLTGDTQVVISPLQTIFREHRFFVVGGQVITGSVYKQGGQLFVSATVDEDALAFANAQIRHWKPADHFVLDVATVPGGHRIVEVNGLNMSGFYAANMGQVLMALEDWYAENSAAKH